MSGLSFESESILAEARAAFAPSADARQRIRSGVAGRVAAGSAVGAAATAGETAGVEASVPGGAIGSSSLIKLAVAGAISAALAGGWGLWQLASSDKPAPAVSAAPPAARAEPSVPSVAAPAIPAPTITAPEVPAVRAAPRGERSAVKRLARGVHEQRADGDLAQEIAIVRAAQRALRQGRPMAAFALLKRHDREIRVPQMEREAWLLRAESLCLDGRAAEGQQILARVRERWPASAGIEAVARLCRGPNR